MRTTAATPRGETVPSNRDQFADAVWFVGLMLGFALIATVIAVVESEPV
jgi:hypothetical protein